MPRCHLVLGPMCAKKTTRIITIKRSFDKKNAKTLIFKNHKDMRYDDGNCVTSHDKDKEECIPIVKTSQIFENEKYKDSHVIIIEEAQFFDSTIVNDCKRIVNDDNKYLIVVALSGDYAMRSFGHVHKLLSIADSIDLATAYCEFCDDFVNASFTAKINNNEEQIEVGIEQYKPVCRKHHKEKSLHIENTTIYVEGESYDKIIMINFPQITYHLSNGNIFVIDDNIHDLSFPHCDFKILCDSPLNILKHSVNKVLILTLKD